MSMNDRTAALIGEDSVSALTDSHITLFGLGAVGGYVLEGLVRAGVGHITVIDSDVFNDTNLNRQILATTDTVGMKKIEAAVERAKSINPDIDIRGIDSFVESGTVKELLKDNPDIIVDAIDTIEPKCALLRYASESGIPTFSSMGAALHLDTQSIKIATLKKTKVCPLAANIRSRLRDTDTSNIICVYSEEKAVSIPSDRDEHGKSILGSVPTIPAIFGMILANEAIRMIITK